MKTPKATRRKKVTIEMIVPMHIFYDCEGDSEALLREAVGKAIREVPIDLGSYGGEGNSYTIIRGEARLNE